ncbi:hypothetical protein [Variovorax sp. EL159]|uniref:hypothetical protein n=1 Tax=unclassified Variovorax TaxID=663243 RepID=UPI00088E0D5A|nr:hypothetical protein [Variovorax sp. EL159]SCX73070.1 hypothetical protein SAMN03159363_4796 [Variovorax sp. EL159]
MRLITSRTHHACALFFIACALSACGGSSNSVGLPNPPVAGTPDPTPPAPDTGVKPEKRCAP